MTWNCRAKGLLYVAVKRAECCLLVDVGTVSVRVACTGLCIAESGDFCQSACHFTLHEHSWCSLIYFMDSMQISLSMSVFISDSFLT